MNFFYVYVLESQSDEFMYTGMTADLKRRIKEHDNGEEKSTKAYAPLELIFYEAYKSKTDAKRREKYLKSTQGKKALQTMLQNYLEE